MNKTIFIALALALVAGCTPKLDSGSGEVAKAPPGSTEVPNAPSGTQPNPPNPNGGSNSNPGAGTPNANTPGPDTKSVPKAPVIPAPEPTQKISNPNSGGWKRTTLSAVQLGQKVSARMKNMSGTYGEARIGIKTGSGSGSVMSEYFFGAGRQVRAGFVIPSAVPSAGTVVLNGQKKVVHDESGIHGPMNLPEQDALAQKLKTSVLQNFPLYFSRALVMNQTDAFDPWAPLMAQVSKSNSGYITSIEERVSDFRGRKITNYRLFAKRKPELISKLGQSEFEIVFDGTHWLPVTINSKVSSPKGPLTQQAWTVHWKFKQEHDPRLFELKISKPDAPKAP